MGKKAGVKYFRRQLEESGEIEGSARQLKATVKSNSKKNQKNKANLNARKSVEDMLKIGKKAEVNNNDEEGAELDQLIEEEDDDEEQDEDQEIDGNEDDEDQDDDELEKELMALNSLQAENQQRMQKKPINAPTKDQIQETLVKIQEMNPTPLPWIERLDITSPEPIQIENVEDDLKRELAFYDQALEATLIGKKNVLATGVPFDRPDDYFAEMIKDDQHMMKVRQRLIDESQKMKRSEEAAKTRMMKKYAKKVQVEKLQARDKAKTAAIEKIKLLRKGKKNLDLNDSEDFDISVDKSDKGNKREKNNEKGGNYRQNKPQKSPKAQLKDKKFGYGGKKRGSKENTRESTDFFGSEKKEAIRKMRTQKSKFPGKAGKGGKITKSRPGKARRQASRGKK